MPFFIVHRDITKMQVDAIVNAANRTLMGGGGVDGAIHRAAGFGLRRECATLGGCETGDAKITGGYRLPSRYVIHTVGPVYIDGKSGEEALLRSCYRTAFTLALERGCESIAFPLISSGAYGYPKDQALRVAVEESRRFLSEFDMTVYLVIYDRLSYTPAYESLGKIAEYLEEHREEDTAIGGAVPPPPDAPRSFLDKVYAKQKKEDTFQAEEDERDEDSFFDGSERDEDSFFDELECEETQFDDIFTFHPSFPFRLEESFSRRLLRLIDEKGMTDVACYKKANIDRKHFSKIRSDGGYQPSKSTAIAFALALELSREEADSLLKTAGFALSRSSKFDLVIEYCIQNRLYDVFEINEILFAFDLPLLGS